MKRLLILLPVFLLGCGATFETRARQTVVAGGIVLDIADREIAQSYTDAARDALAAAQSLPDYESRMETWNEVVAAVADAQTALEAAEKSLDLWDAIGKEPFLDALVKTLNEFENLIAWIRRAGGEVPPEMLQFISGARVLVSAWAQSEV